MLFVKKIKAKNWKNFGNIDISVGERLFIVGANASGKSNFLDIFRFLKDLSNNGLQRAVNSRGGIRKIRNLNARKPSYIAVDIEFIDSETGDEWEYALQFNSRGGTADKPTVYVYEEKVTCNDKEISSRKLEDDILAQYTHLEQPGMNKDFRVLFDTFKNISYMNIIPQLIRESESFIPSNAKEDFYGRNILDRISETNKKTRDSRLKKISKVLQLAVPQFSDLEYMQDEKGHPHLQVRYEHFRQHGAFQREDQFSDGTLRLIGIIWAILDGEGLLLLEEPELYLHSEVVKQLPMLIANAQRAKNGKKRQVFISSHSYELLNTDTIAPEEIVTLNQGKEDTVIEMADVVPTIMQKIDSGFTPAEAVIPHVAPKGIMDGQLSMFDLRSGR